MKKPFEGLWGNSCELRTIEFLLPLHGMEFNITELADDVNVSRQTISKIVKKFDEWGIVKIRMENSITYYSVNGDSPLIKAWENLNNVMIEHILGEEELYEIHEYLESRCSASPITSSEPAIDDDTVSLIQDGQDGIIKLYMFTSAAGSPSEIRQKQSLISTCQSIDGANGKKTFEMQSSIHAPRGMLNAA